MSSFDPTVADAVLRLPKTLGAGATVREARAALEDDHVHMVLITEGGRLLGTLVRSDLPAHLDDAQDDAQPALAHAVLDGRTVAPDVSADAARQLLIERGERRRAVVDADGRLLGLLCLKRHHRGFCTDRDVADRARESPGRAADPTLVTDPGGSLR